MKDTYNMNEIINKNVDMESNKQIRENAEKDVELRKSYPYRFWKLQKCFSWKRFRKMIRPILNVILKMI